MPKVCSFTNFVGFMPNRNLVTPCPKMSFLHFLLSRYLMYVPTSSLLVAFLCWSAPPGSRQDHQTPRNSEASTIQRLSGPCSIRCSERGTGCPAIVHMLLHWI